MRKFAAELAALAPDVILAVSSPAVSPLLQVTRTIPIVLVSNGRDCSGVLPKCTRHPYDHDFGTHSASFSSGLIVAHFLARPRSGFRTETS